jgi:hypothetical protein
MGAETILLGPQGHEFNLSLKENCTLRYVPVTEQWPTEVQGDLVWGPSSFASPDDYTLTLTEQEVSEVRSGLQHFNGRLSMILS